jgi:class 3 adenylate cyclase
VPAADARFCMSCGEALGSETATDTSRRARIAAATPAPLVEKMRAARLTGERKPVTALFADIVGSTSLAEHMDPEDWTQIVNEAFDLMSAAVYEYEGTIAQLQGDAMLAFFGAPVAHEDDPERAIRAALRMLASMDEFSGQLRSSHGIDLRIRAGINTGPVVVGTMDADLRYGYTALGDAMNTAARLQSAAEPGTALIAASTLRLVQGAFDVEDLGEIEVKGRSEPVHAYRVLGARAVPARRRGLESEGLDSPMIGREAQLAVLQRLASAVADGRGRAAILIGEPGIGKTRLLAELRATVDPSTRWLEGRCLSYGQNLPYHLLIDLVRSLLDLHTVTDAADLRAAFDRELLALLGPDGADIAPYLRHLLALPAAQDEEGFILDPETVQDRYAGSIQRLIRAHAARGPLVIVFEDMHWSDPASIKVMREILPLIAQLPILGIGALRDEPEAAGWELVTAASRVFGEDLTEIRLDPLSDADSRTLVANLLVIESLPDAVRDLILARAEGNPFFVEEVVRMLIGRGLIERRDGRWVVSGDIDAVDIPETLHGLLLARIDQLPDAAKRSLRIAAVIGRQFPVRVLERVLGATAGGAEGDDDG